jgi:hypothetical protein
VLLDRRRVVDEVAGSVLVDVEAGNWAVCLKVWASEPKAEDCRDWVGMDWVSLPLEGCCCCELLLGRIEVARASLGDLRLSCACVGEGGGHSQVVEGAKESAACRGRAKGVLPNVLECHLL